MANASMDITAFVGKLLEEDDVELLREGSVPFARQYGVLDGPVGEGDPNAERHPTGSKTASPIDTRSLARMLLMTQSTLTRRGSPTLAHTGRPTGTPLWRASNAATGQPTERAVRPAGLK